MSGFSREWLRLREPLDARSRDPSIATPLRAVRDMPLSVVDLGSGTGANFRYLAPLLGGRQQWLFIDDDRALLDAVDREVEPWASAHAARCTAAEDSLLVEAPGFSCVVQRRRADLATALDEIEFPDRGLVTASALLDLVSDAWLGALATRCRAARASVLFALTYDGRASFAPADPEDERVLELFNRHQTIDKGFGPALGPAAATASAKAFAELGYDVTARPSEWRIGAPERELQAALVDGWLEAAAAIAPEEAVDLERWHERRRALIDAGRSALVVGHVDFVGVLPTALKEPV